MGHSYIGPDPRRAAEPTRGPARPKTILTIEVTHEAGKSEAERDSETELALAHVNQLIGQGYTSGYEFNLSWKMTTDGPQRRDEVDIPTREKAGA